MHKKKNNRESIFCCPNCRKKIEIANDSDSIECNNCGFFIPVVKSIPLLVKNISKLKEEINTVKKSGRKQWYENPQQAQWSGPYRHHLKKRRAHCELILKSYKDLTRNELIGLDLGCGDGVNIPLLSSTFSFLYASDYNILRLLRASHVPGVDQFFLADVTDYPTDDNTFDVIFFNHVLEHIPKDKQALSEVYRILKPNGLVILGVPNEGAFFWQLAYRLQPEIMNTSDHVHFYTIKSLSEKCLKAGFTINDIHPIGWGIPHWGLDSKVRGYKWADDFFEKTGRALIPSQATSLYFVLVK